MTAGSLIGSGTAVRGIGFTVLAALLITLNDGVMKWASGSYPPGEIMVLRGIFMLLPLSFIVWREGGWAALRVKNKRIQALRAALAVGATYCFVFALRAMHLADALAVMLAAPLFMTALAPAILGERVGWRRWSAVLVGFLGVLLIVKPGGDAIRWVALLPLGAALCEALRDLLTRRLSSGETTSSLLTATTVAVILGGLASLPFGWDVPSRGDLALLACAGLILGVAHFIVILAYRTAEVAALAPFRYTNIVWGVIVGYAVWQHIPDAQTFAGALLVVLGGLYIMHRETTLLRRRRGGA
jgi:drug/metabolite transporter (DMT)-like permease